MKRPSTRTAPTTKIPSRSSVRSLYAQFHHRGAAPALVLRGLGDGFDVRMLLEGPAQGFAEDSHATAVDYADAGEAGQKGVVDEFFYGAGGVVDGVADDVDFRG